MEESARFAHWPFARLARRRARPRQIDVAPPRSSALQPGRDFGLRHLFCLPSAQPRVLPRSVCIHTLPCRKYMPPRDRSATARCQSPPTQPASDAAAAAETEKGTQPGSWHRTRPDSSSPGADLGLLAHHKSTYLTGTLPGRLISQPTYLPRYPCPPNSRTSTRFRWRTLHLKKLAASFIRIAKFAMVSPYSSLPIAHRLLSTAHLAR